MSEENKESVINKTGGTIVYNVTTKIETSINSEWIQWLKEVHINDVIQTGCFTKALVLRLLDTDDEGSMTYTIQYFAPDKSSYDLYIDKFAGIMRQKAINKWKDKFIAFRTVMAVVD